MTKLPEEQLNTLKGLPYWEKIEDLINLYEIGILSQEKFNDELLNARTQYRLEKPLNKIDKFTNWVE